MNKEAGFLTFRQGRINDAIPYFTKAVSLMDTDYHDAGMLLTCYQATGDMEAARRAARIALEHSERTVALDQSNGAALGYGACSLAVLGESERAKEWIERALLIDPENLTMRYNLACALATYLRDKDAALALMAPYFQVVSLSQLRHCQVDPDMDPLRDDPRFKEMMAAAEARLAASGAPVAA